GGVDSVFASATHTIGFGIENLTLTGVGLLFPSINGTGNENNNVITGNSGNNVLNGGAGNDTLSGGLGNDTLTGGLGADIFVFTSLFQGIDFVSDFKFSEGDKIQISKAGFGASSTNQFNYNNFTGALSFVGTQFATLQSNLGGGFIPNLDISLV
ncbi:MAG: hypothetical protein ACKO2V_09170, partial [Snowella sp.]